MSQNAASYRVERSKIPASDAIRSSSPASTRRSRSAVVSTTSAVVPVVAEHPDPVALDRSSGVCAGERPGELAVAPLAGQHSGEPVRAIAQRQIESRCGCTHRWSAASSPCPRRSPGPRRAARGTTRWPGSRSPRSGTEPRERRDRLAVGRLGHDEPDRPRVVLQVQDVLREVAAERLRGAATRHRSRAPSDARRRRATRRSPASCSTWETSSTPLRLLGVVADAGQLIGEDAPYVRPHQSFRIVGIATQMASTIAACSSTEATTRPGMSSVSLPILERWAWRLSISERTRRFCTDRTRGDRTHRAGMQAR